LIIFDNKFRHSPSPYSCVHAVAQFCKRVQNT